MTKIERKLYKAQELLEEAKKLIVERDKLIGRGQELLDVVDEDDPKTYKNTFKAMGLGIKAMAKNIKADMKLKRVRNIMRVFS